LLPFGLLAEQLTTEISGARDVQTGFRNTADGDAGTRSKRQPQDCKPIGQTSRGEMVYGLDCKSLKAENISTEYKPNMPPTDMKETVIPKSGAVQTPETTPVTGMNK
jgi:hypothetical protein